MATGIYLDRERFRREIARRGLTQERLSKLSGVCAPTISRALKGRSVNASTLARLAEALDRAPIFSSADAVIRRSPDRVRAARAASQGAGVDEVA